MARPPPEPPQHDLWPESYGREMPPPLDPRGEIFSFARYWDGDRLRVRRGGRPKEDAIQRRERLRRVYAAWLRECVEGWESDTGWRSAAGNRHWRLFRAGYLAGQAGTGEDVALEDHEAWTERVMALPGGERPRILDTEEGPPPERPTPDIWPEWYGREMPPPLDPRGEIVSIVGEAGQAGVILRGRRPKEDAIRRRERLRRVYAVWLRECVKGREMTPLWRGEEGNWHWMTFRGGYLAGEAGVGEDVALEDHETWTERVMALPDGERPRILDTEEGPMPVLPGTIFLTWPGHPEVNDFEGGEPGDEKPDTDGA